MNITIKDIVVKAAILLQLDDIVEYIENLENNINKELEDKTELNQLIRCANLVIGTVASEYFPLIHQELVSGNYIKYKELSKNLIEVRKITINNRRINYRMFFDHIEIAGDDDENYLIEYSFLPNKCDLDDEIEYKSSMINVNIFAYGVACEYCIIIGMTDNALTWDSKFREGISRVNFSKCNNVKTRSWF